MGKGRTNEGVHGADCKALTAPNTSAPNSPTSSPIHVESDDADGSSDDECNPDKNSRCALYSIKRGK